MIDDSTFKQKLKLYNSSIYQLFLIKTCKYMRKVFLLLLAIMAWSATWAADQALNLKGSGTEADPYQVSSAADLQAIAAACNTTRSTNASHYIGVYFKQTADIDMSGVTDFLGIATAPFGTSSSTSYYFAGIYDGGGFTISNMKIAGETFDDNGKAQKNGSTISRRYVGLFGTIEKGAVIKNVTLDATCSVDGYDYVGGIVGYIYSTQSSTVQNCKSAAKVTAYYQYAGGIVGYAKQTTTAGYEVIIKNCVNTGRVTAGRYDAGGIVGFMAVGSVVGCQNEGTVSCEEINALYTSGFQAAGGIIGSMQNKATVTNCVNLGKVYSATKRAGGIAGEYVSYSSTMTGCANFGEISCPDASTIGAIAGSGSSSTSAPKLSGCLYDSQLGEKPVSANDADGAIGLLTSELTSGNVAGLDASVWTVKAGFYPYLTALKTAGTEALASLYFTLPADETATNFKTSATLPAGVNATMRDGKAFTVAGGKITAGDVQAITADVVTLTKDGQTKDIAVQKVPKLWNGTGTAADPYLIENAQDLADMAMMTDKKQLNHYKGVYFKQTADIDASSLTDFHGIAVADSISDPSTVVWFSGNYDGQGHSVTLNIKDVGYDAKGAVRSQNYSGSYSSVGLFGVLADSAVVKNLTIKGTVVGYTKVGSVAGLLRTGSIVENVTNEAAIYSSFDYAGGIVGYVGASSDVTPMVKGCRNKGTVTTGSTKAGGIVGGNYGYIELCQNDGKVVADHFADAKSNAGAQYDAGGIAGYNSTFITNCLNTGTVYAVRQYAGGIVGCSSSISAVKGLVKGVVNLGNVLTTDATTLGAIAAHVTGSSDVSYESVYFDGQISGVPAISNHASEGVTAESTSTLTSGKVEGLDASVWTLKAGFYPVLKQFDDAWSEDVASTYITLPEGEKSINFKTTGTISTAQDDITASLQDGSLFKIADGKLTAGVSKSIVVDTLVLKNGTYTLLVPLQKLPKLWSGAGTEADPYLIKTADDFLAASDLLNNANYSYEGEYFKVVADLDFSGKDLVPLGNSATGFAGTFDGQGHTFSNVTYEATGEEGDPHTGIDVALFSYTDPGSVVKNIKLANSKITGFKNVAGIVAQSKGAVTGCEVAATVEIIDTVTFKRTNTANYLGGIVALDNSTGEVIYRDNVNRAKLTGFLGIGGIIAYSKNDNAKIINCQNYGDITTTAVQWVQNQGTSNKTIWPNVYAGGIAGTFYGSVDSCANYGSNTSSTGQYQAGIVAEWGHNSTGNTLTNCENHGTITAGYAYAGGIVAQVASAGSDYALTIANCYNDGDITVNYYEYAGGIAAFGNLNTKINYCYNLGNVTLTNLRDDNYKTSLKSTFGGGIIGSTPGKGTVIDHCWNAGHVKGPGYMGGIVGQGTLQNNVVTNCFNIGTVETDSTNASTAWAAGGIASQGRLSLTNCYNAGLVKGSRYVAGIMGYNTKGTTTSPGTDTKNVYNIGEIKAYEVEYSGKTYPEDRGHVYGAGSTPECTLTNGYYLEDGQKLNADSIFSAVGLTSQKLTGSALADSLGDGFVYNQYAFPMIKGLESVDAAKAYASYFGLAEGETLDAISTRLPLSALEGVTWTATGGIKVQGGKAVPTALGPATLTATCGKFSKTYNLTITAIPALLGDLNGDGVVNVSDVTILVNAIAAGNTDSAYDIDGNGLVNVSDVTYLVNVVLGAI